VNENTRRALNITITHLKVQQQIVETAIAAILAVLGEGDMVPVERASPPAPRPRLPRVTGKVTPPSRKPTSGATHDAPTEAILGYLKAHGPSAPKQVREALKLSEAACKVALRQLQADKRIIGEGATTQRTYRAVTTKTVKAAHRSVSPALVATDDEYETVWDGASPQPLSSANGGRA